MNTFEKEDKYESGVYPKKQVEIVKGSGTKLWAADGTEYLDMGANYGVCNVGHCHPTITKAIQEQSQQLMFIQATMYNDVRAKFLEKLSQVSGMDRAFLCNSGTESVEAAFKFSRACTGRNEIVAAMKAFHGRSLGALSATWKKEYRAPFGELLPGVKHFPYGNLEKLKEKVNSNTAAVILEPVQGEGGVNLPSPDFLKGARDICTDAGAFLILDEIQTGFGRTGKMFAKEHFGVEPDIMTVAKSIAGGFPMGAMLANENACAVPKTSHGSTFGGNPLACAAGLATIEVIEKENLVNQSKEMGDYFVEQLRTIENDKIREVRGLGLIIGVELKEKSGPYLSKLLEQNIIALPAGKTVVRFLPPLTISKDEIDTTVKALQQVLV